MAAPNNPVRSITIVGGGTAGWMTAAVLSQWLSKVKIRLVESEEIGTIGVGEATIPHIRNYFALAGIELRDVLEHSMATFKMGIQFVDWGAPGEAYIHGFGKIGRDMLWLHPHQLWLAARARDPGRVKSFDHYSLNCLAALENRFAFADARNPQSPLADLDYAYHFDASLIARLLRTKSEERGVERVEGKIVDVTKADDGSIASVTLADGRTVDGDFFVDCSGMRALLIGGALGVDYEDWSQWLLCDRAQAVPCESVSPLTPYTRATARTAGWQWRIPLQHRIGNGHVYASSLMSDDAAADVLLANLDGKPLADPRPVRFQPGRRVRVWEKNVLAVGLSAGFLEPLESTSIHLIQTAVHRLLALFPAEGISQADVDEFNLQARIEMEDVRDFVIAHYKVTRRSGEPFWDYVREMPVPDTLAERLDLFRSSGRFFKHQAAELFAEESWVQVLIGQGLDMRADPVTQFVDDDALFGFLDDLADVIGDVARDLPDHAAVIESLLKGAAPQAAPVAPPRMNFTINYPARS
ncbi:tryptophan 7-halogenase [Sphingomonas sabuli]|uniref:Tryptophan 7-halogenase n=1 Tax=Sphingomonas sabuli TaxID=2764186 RepID=A0A7G9KZU3_9SPHN|nr:tryptophan halogenase family protein [Sphingomonas sabuli]QNM81892.1 tryptophan 7-halogenase [Sphingomonas sabuli]